MTGILFIARLGSTRLSNKHLIKAGEKTFIEWLISRFVHEFNQEIKQNKIKLIVATSENSENKKFETILKSLPVSIFYGDDQNIPKRQLECAKQYQLSQIISIDGDDILCSTKAAKKVFHYLTDSSFNLVKSVGLPLGMNVMGYSTAVLEQGLKNRDEKLETGWGRIFDKMKTKEIEFKNFGGDIDLRFTLDYDLDANFFSAIINHIGNKIISIDDQDLINEVLENKFFNLNISLNKQYWNNFNLQKTSESSNNK